MAMLKHSMHSETPCPACGDLDGCHLPNQSLRVSVKEMALVEYAAHAANCHKQLVEACRAALEEVTAVRIAGGDREADEFEAMLRAALAAAEGE